MTIVHAAAVGHVVANEAVKLVLPAHALWYHYVGEYPEDPFDPKPDDTFGMYFESKCNARYQEVCGNGCLDGIDYHIRNGSGRVVETKTFQCVKNHNPVLDSDRQALQDCLNHIEYELKEFVTEKLDARFLEVAVGQGVHKRDDGVSEADVLLSVKKISDENNKLGIQAVKRMKDSMTARQTIQPIVDTFFEQQPFQTKITKPLVSVVGGMKKIVLLKKTQSGWSGSYWYQFAMAIGKLYVRKLNDRCPQSSLRKKGKKSGTNVGAASAQDAAEVAILVQIRALIIAADADELTPGGTLDLIKALVTPAEPPVSGTALAGAIGNIGGAETATIGGTSHGATTSEFDCDAGQFTASELDDIFGGVPVPPGDHERQQQPALTENNPVALTEPANEVYAPSAATDIIATTALSPLLTPVPEPPYRNCQQPAPSQRTVAVPCAPVPPPAPDQQVPLEQTGAASGPPSADSTRHVTSPQHSVMGAVPSTRPAPTQQLPVPAAAAQQPRHPTLPPTDLSSPPHDVSRGLATHEVIVDESIAIGTASAPAPADAPAGDEPSTVPTNERKRASSPTTGSPRQHKRTKETDTSCENESNNMTENKTKSKKKSKKKSNKKASVPKNKVTSVSSTETSGDKSTDPVVVVDNGGKCPKCKNSYECFELPAYFKDGGRFFKSRCIVCKEPARPMARNGSIWACRGHPLDCNAVWCGKSSCLLKCPGAQQAACSTRKRQRTKRVVHDA